jgi:chromosome segregation ATPase
MSSKLNSDITSITSDSKHAIKLEIDRLESRLKNFRQRKKPLKEQLDFLNSRIDIITLRIQEMKKDLN